MPARSASRPRRCIWQDAKKRKANRERRRFENAKGGRAHLMQAFARLLDSLSFQPARNAKLRLIEAYLRETPDPDRGWALAALTGGLDFAAAKPALLRSFGQEKIGEELFHLSHDYVGDLAEPLALVWETRPDAGPPPPLAEVVETLQRA